MTQEQFSALQGVAIAETVTDKFFHVHCEDGFQMTKWNEGDDIKEYQGFQCFYAPIKEDGNYDDVRIITDAQHEELEAQKNAAFEAEMEKERQELTPEEPQPETAE